MLNFPLGAGTSAHLLGGTLVAVVLGPWAGMLVIFAVVLIQALLFQDGGIAALGANTLNLAVLGVGAGWLLFRWLYALTGAGQRRLLVAAAVAAYGATAVVGVAVAVSLALCAWSRWVLRAGGGRQPRDRRPGRGRPTVAILAGLARGRPDLVTAAARQPRPRVRAMAWTAAALSVAVALLAVYAASSAPDALEAAVARLGLAGPARPDFQAPFADYTAPIGAPRVAALLGC
jgi:cobalt/nickel transport system permease protein